MAPRDGVSVGGIRRMSNNAPPPPPPYTNEEPTTPYNWAAGQYGASTTPTPVQERPVTNWLLEPIGWGDLFPDSPLLARNQPGYGVPSPQEKAFRREQANIGNNPAYQSNVSEPEVGMTLDEVIAKFAGQGGGGGGRGPDYSQYRQAITGQADELNARIQAMYNQLADQAGENVGRIKDVYGGAEQGIGNVYDSATGNVAQAFGSAQQQAADQLARLGIEAAAPTVINPMALSQAQAVSGLEQGRASGQAAAQRYGAAAGGFGSQMAQVAQQQGTEMNAAILAALQQRLNESLLMEEQGRASGGGGGGNPMGSAMEYLKLQEMFNAPAVAQQEMQFRAAEIAADNRLSQQDKLITLWSDIRNDYDSDEEAWQAAQAAIQQAQTFFG
jgi:hypothetical protein